MSKLIIIRGNSGSGKSTIAKKLKYEMGYGTMLIPQDMVRRDMLRVRDVPDNPAIQLIYDMACYGKQIGYDVIIEGILPRRLYGAMFEKLAAQFDNTHVYYFGLSFEETLRRHETKPDARDFGEKEMREWWCERDMLGENDRIITSDMSEDEIITRIINTMAP